MPWIYLLAVRPWTHHFTILCKMRMIIAVSSQSCLKERQKVARDKPSVADSANTLALSVVPLTQLADIDWVLPPCCADPVLEDLTGW